MATTLRWVSTAGGCGVGREQLAHDLGVEPESRLRSVAEADRLQRDRVFVDPGALDSEFDR